MRHGRDLFGATGVVFLAVLTVGLAFSGPAWAQVSATAQLMEAKSKLDLVSRSEALRPDGQADARFRLALQAPGKVLTGLEIRNTSGQYSVWDTFPGNGMWLVAVVQVYDASREEPYSLRLASDQQGRLARPGLDVGQETVLDLYVQDNGSIAGGNTGYQLTMFFGDGSKTTVPVAGMGSAPAAGQTQAPAPGGVQGGGEITETRAYILDAAGGQDLVGPGEALRPNGQPDSVIRLEVQALDKVLTGLEMRNTSGQYSVWDTFPGNGMWIMAVVLQPGDGGGPRLVSDQQGRMRELDLNQGARLDLHVHDNGSIAGGNTGYQLTLFFKDGSKETVPVAGQ